MDSKKKVQVIKEAIKQMMEEDDRDDDDDGDRLLSKLMYKLEKLEEGEASAVVSSSSSTTTRSTLSSEKEKEERIVKELKKLKRQNVITQCLVSALILVTVVWQISEVSIILKLKDGVAHPFRSMATILTNIIKPKPKLPDIVADPSNLIKQEEEDEEDSTPASVHHPLKLHLPNLPFH